MKKSSLYRVLSYLVVLGIFNLIFWLIGPEMTAARWISYALIHVSFLTILITPYFTSSHKDGQVGGMLLQNVSRVYFVVQLLVSILFLFVWAESKTWLKISIGVQGVLLLVYLGFVFFIMFSSNSYNDAQEKHEAHKTAKLAVGALKVIRANCADDEFKEELQTIIDQATVIPVTESISTQFDLTVKKLDRAVRAKDSEKTAESINELKALLG